MSGNGKEKDNEKPAGESAPGSASEKLDGWKEAILFFTLRVCDSSYLPFTMVGAFLLGLVWLITRHLDSHDNLEFLDRLTASGWVWLGWVLALAEIPVARWVLTRSTADRNRRIEDLQQEIAEARKRLKQGKQPELDLELENGK